MAKPCLYKYKIKYICASVDNHIPRDDIFDYHLLGECNIYLICEFNPMERNTFYGETAYVLGDLGRSWINFKDLGGKGKCLQGAEEFSFGDLGESVHYFQGSMDHRPRHPGGPTTDACLTADPGFARSILARSHSFREIDRSPPSL